jgi:short-subunit dehydrogenase
MPENEQFALVTGASSGIGLALSGELAKLGFPLLMVSNEENEIARAAGEIQAQYHVTAIPLYMDLSHTGSAAQLFDYCRNEKITVKIIVNNAGIFFFKDIIDTHPERMETMINLHVYTPVMICRLFAAQMAAENREGYIMNMASIAAWMMMPGIALYSATKSFLRCFSRAMRHELSGRGISITTVCPGAAATGLYNLPPRYMKLGIGLGIIMPAQKLARLALKKMFKRKAEYIPGGLINRLFVFLVESLPDAMIRQIRKKILNLNAGA